MSPTVKPLPSALQLLLSRERLEVWATGLVLTIQIGAILPVIFLESNGDLSDASRSKLRLISMLSYLMALGLLAPHGSRFVHLARRNWLLLLLVCMTFCSVIWSVSPSISLRRAIGFAGSLLISYFIVLRFTPHEFRRLISSLIGLYMIASLVLMVLAPRMAFMALDGNLRGVFYNKNSLGWVAGIGVILAIIFIIERPRNLWATGLLCSSLACLSLSGSMTGTISVGVGIVLISFLTLLPRLTAQGRMFFLLIFLQVLTFTLIGMSQFLVPALEGLGKDATLTGRVPLWELVDHAINLHPLLGYGYEAFWTDNNDLAWVIWAQIGWNAPHSHMGYREVLLGLGLPGIILLCFLFVQSLQAGFTLHINQPKNGWLWLNVLIGMFLIMNLTESLFLAAGDLPSLLVLVGILAFNAPFARASLASKVAQDFRP